MNEELKSAVDRVTKAAAWLDTEAPNWDEKIDLVSLQMYRSGSCIMGQLGLWELTNLGKETDYWLYHRAAFMDIEHYYSILTKAWKQVIVERRGA